MSYWVNITQHLFFNPTILCITHNQRSQSLTPPGTGLFDNATLEGAFVQLLKTFNVESNYTINLHFDERSKSFPMDRDLQLNLKRILQEQFRNIIKHAKASTIDVSVISQENSLQMTIADNGIGFNQNGFKTGIGLANMNRRAQLFAGSLAIASELGKGCKIVVTVPIGERK